MYRYTWAEAGITQEADRDIIKSNLLKQYGSVGAFDRRLALVLFESLANSAGICTLNQVYP